MARPTSLRAFRAGLYEEHLEEASFLYDQCHTMRSRPERRWRDAAAFEERLERHIDALVVGGDFAIEVCRARLSDTEAGALHAIAACLCRQGRGELMAELFNGIPLEAHDKIVAVSRALSLELPPAWASFVEAAMARDERLVEYLAPVCGWRRIPCQSALMASLKRHPCIEAVEALGRLRAVEAIPVLTALLPSEDAGLRMAALEALLRIGAASTLDALHVPAQHEEWPRGAFAVGGSAHALHVLMPPGHPPGDARTLLNLGVLGLPESLRVVHECLAVEPLAESAATALHWILGAPLAQEVHVDAAVDEAELFPRELGAWRRYRLAPQGADGRPFGTSEQRPSTDPLAWRSWLAAHADRFRPGLRYRLGRPISPRVLLDVLRSADTDSRLRRCCADELAIRYGCDVALEMDMPVAWQDRALQHIDAWCSRHASHFEPGAFYFAGRPQLG